jgi:hypothetical protein
MLIAVIWTATALQPCLMASVPDPTAAHANRGMSEHHASGRRANPDCAHCLHSENTSDSLAQPADSACIGDDQAPWLTQTKPLEAERIHRLPHQPSFAQSPEPAAHIDLLPDASLSRPTQRAAGPALFDLFRSYLK